jgi:hypothetical protein
MQYPLNNDFYQAIIANLPNSYARRSAAGFASGHSTIGEDKAIRKKYFLVRNWRTIGRIIP